MFDVAKLGKGSILLSLGAAASALLSFLLLPILARLLQPSDFGVAVVALSVFELGTLLGGTGGFAAAVTYFKDQGDIYDQSAYWLSLLLGLCLGAVCLVSADEIANIFGSPESASLIRVVSLLIPLDALAGLSEAFIARKFQFGRITCIKLVASILSSAAAVAFALQGYGVWSLVWQYTIFVLVRFMGFLMFSDHRLRFTFSQSAIRQMLPYFLRVTGAEVFTWASRQSPLLLVSTFLGVASAGASRVSDRFTELPRQIVAESISKSLFVGVANVSDSDATRGYLWALRLNSIILFPAFFGLISLAQPLTASILGPKFAPYWPIVALFAVGQIAQVPFNCSPPFLKARSHTSALLIISGFRALLIFCGVAFGCIAYGTLWSAVFGLVMAKFITSIASTTYIRQKFSIEFWEMQVAMAAPMWSSLLMCGSILLLHSYVLKPFGPYMSSAIGIVIGVGIYLCSLYFVSPRDFRIAIDMAQKFKKRL